MIIFTFGDGKEESMFNKKTFFPIVSLILLITTFSRTQETGVLPEKTLSPFFYVQTDDPNLDQLPLKSVSATVNIVGVIADVTIRQVYTNEGAKPLEATYVFPASINAAVYGMKMIIGDRQIVAEIREREQAQKEFEEAQEEGKSASLLEQSRPNVFQMSVTNIMPEDTIIVELLYTELLVPAEGVYEFVYPTVVGPRYSNQPLSEADPEDLFVASPYTHEGEDPTYIFDISVDLTTGLSISYLDCISHQVLTEMISSDHAWILLDPSEVFGGNRDYILHYGLQGQEIAGGLLLYEGEEENFFLLMGQPPERVEEAEIPPREYIFIMDVSGSMHGFPITVSKTLLRDLIGSLRSNDMFNVLFFAGGSALMAEASVPANSNNIVQALDMIDQQTGGGGTELLPAMQRALQLPRPDDSTSRILVIATDGYVNVEAETFNLIHQHLNEANLFAFGIGKSVNRYIIQGMARAGMGEPFIAINEEEAETMAARFKEYVRAPVLTQIDLAFNGFNAYDIEPPSIPDIFAERPVIVFGKWFGQPQGTLVLSGKTGLGEYQTDFQVSDFQARETNAALKYLWARQRIALLSDYASSKVDEEIKKEIIELGLQYNLLTQYTSFIAVDKIVRNDGTELSRVEQPLPMPQGVEDSAIAGGTMVDTGRQEAIDYESVNHIIRIQNCPNPFNPNTLFQYTLSQDCHIRLIIYNIKGEEIRVIVDAWKSAGDHEIEWDGKDRVGRILSAGIYFYKLQAGEFTAVRKMVLVR
jgi:Ca-activated chloride channel family protein